MSAANGVPANNGQAALAAAAGVDTWHSCEVNASEEGAAAAAAAAAAADSGAGVHDKHRSAATAAAIAAAAAGAGRRKSRFNQQQLVSPDGDIRLQARRSVKSFPLANLELER
jgi:hypothetical protein